MVFIDTATDTSRILQNLALPADSSVSLLTLGGGSLLIVEGDFVVTGISNVVVQAKNTRAQVGGQWQGTGVTIETPNLPKHPTCAWMRGARSPPTPEVTAADRARVPAVQRGRRGTSPKRAAGNLRGNAY